jgi:hypothetical protein
VLREGCGLAGHGGGGLGFIGKYVYIWRVLLLVFEYLEGFIHMFYTQGFIHVVL